MCHNLPGIFTRLPPAARELVADLGICHYVVVMKQPNGEVVQFDFGPKGGRDVSASRGGIPAEVRERPLQPGLFESAPVLYVGTTTMGLEEIRAFNAKQPGVYAILRTDW